MSRKTPMSLISGMPILVGCDQFSVPHPSCAIGEKSPPACAAAGDEGPWTLQHWSLCKRPEPLQGHNSRNVTVWPLPFPLSLCVYSNLFYMNIIWERHIFSGLKWLKKKKPPRESPKRSGHSVVLSHILLLWLIMQPAMQINCKGEKRMCVNILSPTEWGLGSLCIICVTIMT